MIIAMIKNNDNKFYTVTLITTIINILYIMFNILYIMFVSLHTCFRTLCERTKMAEPCVAMAVNLLTSFGPGFNSWVDSFRLHPVIHSLFCTAVSRLVPLSPLKSGTDILRFNIFQDISSEDDDGELDKESGWLSETHQNLAWNEPASDMLMFLHSLSVILLNLVTSCDMSCDHGVTYGVCVTGEKRSHCWADFGLALGAGAICRWRKC